LRRRRSLRHQPRCGGISATTTPVQRLAAKTGVFLTASCLDLAAVFGLSPPHLSGKLAEKASRLL